MKVDHLLDLPVDLIYVQRLQHDLTYTVKKNNCTLRKTEKIANQEILYVAVTRTVKI